jgi:hypothetical protein
MSYYAMDLRSDLLIVRYLFCWASYAVLVASDELCRVALLPNDEGDLVAHL